jgi:hypothetical protein
VSAAGHTPGPWHVIAVSRGPVRKVLGDESITKDVDHYLLSSRNTTVATFYRPQDAAILRASPGLLTALKGCADALREAGKDFALAYPLAARPNLYELHEIEARAAILKASGGDR